MMTIAPMSVDELETVIGWAAEEGWNPGLDDAAAFHAADPGGFLLGRIGGDPIAAISAVRQGGALGFVGLYICRPEHRGRGRGRAVWDAGLARLDGLAVGLDGVVAQQENYRRSGFETAFTTTRYAGPVASAGSPEGLAPPDADDIAEMLAWDRACFGVDRAAYLGPWFRDAETRRTLALRRDGALAGYGTIRRCREGCKIGPLTARSPDDALDLVEGLARAFGPGPVMIDIPDTRGTPPPLARALSLEPVFSTARMYRGTPPPLRLDDVQGLATLELG